MMAAWNLQDVGLRQQLGWNELTFPHEELCASWKSLAISAPIRADTSIRPKWETKTTTATSITLQQRRTAEKTHSSQPGNSISVFITVSKQKDTLIWEPSGRGENGLDADKRWWSGRKPQLRNEEGGKEGSMMGWEEKRGKSRNMRMAVSGGCGSRGGAVCVITGPPRWENKTHGSIIQRRSARDGRRRLLKEHTCSVRRTRLAYVLVEERRYEANKLLCFCLFF